MAVVAPGARVAVATLALALACRPGTAHRAAEPAPPPTQPGVGDEFAERGLIVIPQDRACHRRAELEPVALVAATVCARVGEDRWAELEEGAVLFPGDGLVVYVEVGRRAYVHLIQRQGATTTLVWPRGDGAKFLEPGEVRQIPGAGYEMKLDDDTGELELFVIASEAPLRDVDVKLADMIEGLHDLLGGRESGASVANSSDPEADPPRPKRARAGRPRHAAGPLPQLRERGSVARLPNTGRHDATPDERGVAIVRFRIEHRPR